MVEILRRKIEVVKKNYKRNPHEFEKYAVLAVTSVYGVDLLQDNVNECQERLYKIFEKTYTSVCRNETSNDCKQAVRYILKRNILCGDALTLKAIDGEPIIFSEWSLVHGNSIKRRDFRLDEMMLEKKPEILPLFQENWEFDEEVKAFIPKPIREFPLIDYRRVQDAE